MHCRVVEHVQVVIMKSVQHLVNIVHIFGRRGGGRPGFCSREHCVLVVVESGVV